MKKAFTLIELLVVITIIVLMTGAAVVSYSAFLKQSRDAKRKSDLGEVAAALEMYRSNNDTYPAAMSTLTSGTVYIQSIPNDPKTGSAYYFTGSSSDYTLGAYLENGGASCSGSPSCGTFTCNYCLGPYGQK